MPLSEKQREYMKNASHRWNIKVGATRSGKTYCDYFMIPKRIRQASDDGIIVLIGYTTGTLCRNILDPMRRIWGEALVGNVNGSDQVTLFGRSCYLLGADRATQAAKLQGTGIVYCYGDEITTWCQDVFTMLKSRLDRPGSCFDGTCNPDHPNHWFRAFLDSGADIYEQTYRIDDNPFLPPSFVSSLKKEYAGTVWFDRYILGRWTAAEGAVYKKFAEDPGAFQTGEGEIRGEDIARITVGVDFGGTKSGTAFAAVGFLKSEGRIAVLRSRRYTDEMDPSLLSARFCDFLAETEEEYIPVGTVFCDSAEPILIRCLREAARERGFGAVIHRALKSSIRDRIRLTVILMAQGRLLLTPEAKSLSDALMTAVWNPGKQQDERLDDGTTDIDSLDAYEYAIEREAKRLTLRCRPVQDKNRIFKTERNG